MRLLLFLIFLAGCPIRAEEEFGPSSVCDCRFVEDRLPDKTYIVAISMPKDLNFDDDQAVVNLIFNENGKAVFNGTTVLFKRGDGSRNNTFTVSENLLINMETRICFLRKGIGYTLSIRAIRGKSGNLVPDIKIKKDF